VFRRFVSVPPAAGGAAWLQDRLRGEPARVDLPTGTRIVLLRVPLALSSAGQLVAPPIVTLVEARVVPPESAELQELLVPPFHVLEGRRARLTHPQRPGGGLERLPAEHKLPLMGSCLPGIEARAPLRQVCRHCHGPRGQLLMSTMSHGPHWFHATSDPDLLVRSAIHEKRASAGYQELLNSF
jgi:hypothetical protein